MSLGLVAYDDSDESENESDSEANSKNNPSKPNEKLLTSQSTIISSPLGKSCTEEKVTLANLNEKSEFDGNVKSTKFHIPESKVSLLNTDFDVKCLTSGMKSGGPVKITIPSLNEIEDDSEEYRTKKKLKPSKTGSGLFALLPDPKTTLIPQSTTKKRNNPVNKQQNTIKKAKPTPTPEGKHSLISYEDSGDDDDGSGTDFFSLESKDQVPPIDISSDDSFPPKADDHVQQASVVEEGPKTDDDALQFNESFQPNTWHVASSSRPSPSGYQPPSEYSSQPTSEYQTGEFMTFSNSDLELDKEAMQQLCGRRDRLKMQEVSLIDVSGDSIMPDSREWLTKQISEEQAQRPSHKKRDGPTPQQKRKHQITYLAYQAKENELELKNQWSNNRMSRKQTQAKYGF